MGREQSMFVRDGFACKSSYLISIFSYKSILILSKFMSISVYFNVYFIKYGLSTYDHYCQL